MDVMLVPLFLRGEHMANEGQQQVIHALFVLRKVPVNESNYDATEVFIAKPKNPDVQSAVWSSYTNHNTVKEPIGVTPNGVPSFCGMSTKDVYQTRTLGRVVLFLSLETA